MEKRKIKIKSQLIKKILKFLTLPVILFIVLFICLKNGIYIEKLEFSSFNLEKLYIKLDKKLILNAKKVIINSQKQNSDEEKSLTKAVNLIKKIKYLYWFFEEIDIAEIYANNYPVKFLYKDNLFFVDGKSLRIEISLKISDNNIQANLNDFLLKDYNVSFDGILLINPSTKFYNFKGKLDSDFLQSNVNLSAKREEFSYELSQVRSSNISKVFNVLKENSIVLPENLDIWVGGKVRASEYYIENLNGFVDFGKHRYYLDEIKAKGYVKDLRIVLDTNIDPITSPFVELEFNKQRLDFKFNELKFNNYNLSKSQVYIYDMLNQKAGIYIKIKSDDARLDYRVNKILRLYDIHMPFLQNTGKTKTNLVLQFPFEYPEKIFYEGRFDIVNSNIDIQDFKITKAKVDLKKDKIEIKEANIESNYTNSDLNASLNLKQKKGDIDIYASFIDLPSQSLKMIDKNLKLELKFDQNTTLINKEFGILVDLDQGLRLYIAKLSKLRSYSKLMQENNIYDGELNINTNDFINYQVDLNNTTFDSFLIHKDRNPYEYDNFYADIKGDDFNLTSKSGVIFAQGKKHDVNITLNNVDLLISQYNTQSVLQDNDEYNIYAKNVDILLKDYNKTLSFDDFKARLKKDYLKIDANKSKANFDLLLDKNNFKIQALKMDDDFLNIFMRKNIFENGEFNLYIDGNSTDFFKGKFLFKNTYLKDLKFHQQFLSFIDSIPSLLLFKAPSFNEKGFSVENAGVSFHRQKDLFDIEALNFNGSSADILGQVKINLRNLQIDGLLELRTLKSATSVISVVPIINQIILGKDRQISTLIKLEGTVDNPEFKTQLLSQGFGLPYHLIKNIFELPTNLVK
ncbi:AsmA-like C-terminal domain-containing protein [Campylobacter volucris]|uniref:YhdP family protein n=1 Tax=Campylobacter volucris TaxID=1031542 RepID=UPI0021C3BBE9|nr:AsmA-like C-terminal domain-containing protein [Campylobacter volucris]